MTNRLLTLFLAIVLAAVLLGGAALILMAA
jgi:hypothetical protein